MFERVDKTELEKLFESAKKAVNDGSLGVCRKCVTDIELYLDAKADVECDYTTLNISIQTLACAIYALLDAVNEKELDGNTAQKIDFDSCFWLLGLLRNKRVSYSVSGVSTVERGETNLLTVLFNSMLVLPRNTLRGYFAESYSKLLEMPFTGNIPMQCYKIATEALSELIDVNSQYHQPDFESVARIRAEQLGLSLCNITEASALKLC